MWSVIKHNPISAFAVLVVALVGGFLAYMSVWQTNILASPEWCSKALQAERITPGNSFQGLTGCIDIMKIQLQAMALDSHINAGTFAMVLIVLIVVVIAGARASWKLSTSGLEGSVGKEEPVKVTVENPPSSPVPTTESKPAPTPAPAPAPAAAPNPNYTGPAMPPPPTS